jgi:transitional endoplasmic reticulum ATPase
MDSKALQNVYQEYTRNGDALMSRARNVYHAALRHHYTNYHVVSVDPENAEFLEFAEAGHAQAQFDQVGEHYEATRKYTAAHGGREDTGAGNLSDDVYFGRYKYVWQDKTYFLYRTSWQTFYGSDTFWYFILYPRKADAVENNKNSISCPEIDDLLLQLGRWSAIPHKDIYVFDGGWHRRSKSTWDSIKNANWDDVVMDPKTKARLMKDTLTFFSPATRAVFAKYRLPYKRGLLLYGAPGNGKTITIKALIAHLMRQTDPVPAFYIKSTTDKCNGDQTSIRKIFKQARKLAPCVLVFEDLDSMVTDETRSYFLNEVDGMDSNDGILMIASTNHIDKIDESIRSRPSRFDRKYGFDLPARDDRVRYAEHWRKKLADNEDIEFTDEMCQVVADLTPEYSYAYMQEVFISSLMVVARKAAGEEDDWDVVNTESANQSDDEALKESKKSTSKDKDNTETTDEEPANDTPKKRQVPDVKVSDELKANEFYKILFNQVTILTREMSTREEEKAKEEAKKKEEEAKAKEKSTECATCATPKA